MSPGFAFSIDNSAPVTAAQRTSCNEICESDYFVSFFENNPFTAVPPLQINPKCGIVHSVITRVCEIVFER